MFLGKTKLYLESSSESDHEEPPTRDRYVEITSLVTVPHISVQIENVSA